MPRRAPQASKNSQAPARTGARAATLAKPYEPTAAERVAVEAHFARAKAQKGAPAPQLRIAYKEPGVVEIGVDHPDQRLGMLLVKASLGIQDGDVFRGLLNQIAIASSKGGKVDEQTANFILSVIRGIEPRDALEAMLAAQMAAIHSAMMTFSRRLANVDNIQQQDSAQAAFTRLARTFAAQMSALKDYRSRGEQRMVVQHVTVSDGSQAIIGNVSSGTRGVSEKVGVQPDDP